MDMARGKMGPAIAIGQIQGDVGGGLPLPQQETDSLQVKGNVRHHDPPGIAVIERGGRVETPAGILDSLGRIWPAMAYKLIDSLKKVLVGFGLDIERAGPEGWRVQPGPRFRRCNRPAV